MQISLWSFQKRKNSTKVPAGAGTVVTCTLKEATSVMNPHFIVSSNPSGYNYLQWGVNYYFISDVVFVHNVVWEISCDQDVLATFASQIKTTTAFIEYADSYDARIYDPRLAKKINATETSTQELVPYINSVGYCVLNVIGEGSSGVYDITYGSAQSLMNQVSSWWTQWTSKFTWNDPAEAIKNIGAVIGTGNVAETIKSLIWVPADSPSHSGSAQTIHCGLYESTVSGAPFNIDAMNTGSFSMTIPHPSNVMLRTSATCEYTLYYPFIGNISISADILADESTLNIQYSLANATGELVIAITTGSGKYIGTYGATMSCSLPIGSSGIQPRTLMTAIGIGAAGLVAGGAGIAAAAGTEAGVTAGAVGAAATKALTAASAGLMSMQGTTNSVGGVGSCASVGLSPYAKLTCSYWDVSDVGSNLTSYIGNPYYKVDQIGNHGFVRCSGASLDAIGLSEQIDRVNAFLGAGIYVE